MTEAVSTKSATAATADSVDRLERVNILGIGVSAIDMDLGVRRIHRWIEARESQYVCVTGVHGIMESQRDEELRRIHNEAGLVTPDGMPLVWISRYLGHSHVRRVYGPDLVLALCDRARTAGHRFFLYGGGEGVPDLLATKLEARFPGVRIVGTFSPPFRPLTNTEEDDIAARINHAGPDIVLVGLSTPKQERWMARFIDRLEAPVLIGVGAAFDFHAGLKPQAPRWMQSCGLEWFFRLLCEPTRLWKRYLINNPLFVASIVRQLSGQKKYTLQP